MDRKASIIAQANADLDENNRLEQELVSRHEGEFILARPADITQRQFRRRSWTFASQIVSASMIRPVADDDAN